MREIPLAGPNACRLEIDEARLTVHEKDVVRMRRAVDWNVRVRRRQRLYARDQPIERPVQQKTIIRICLLCHP